MRTTIRCIVCGNKFEDDIKKYLNGKLEICEECRKLRQDDKRRMKK